MTYPVPEQVTALLREAEEHLHGWRFEHALKVLADAGAYLRRYADGSTDDPAAVVAVMSAEALREVGDVDQARHLVEDLVGDLDVRLGGAHPTTVRAFALLGALYHDRGWLEHAADCYRRVRDSRAAPHGPAGRAIRRTAANQALLHADRGDLRRAVDELTAAHAGLHRFHGGANPGTLHVAADLARLLHRVGRTDDARRLLLDSIRRASAGLVAEHPLHAALAADLDRLAPPGRHRARPDLATPALLVLAPMAGATVGAALTLLLLHACGPLVLGGRR